MPNTKRGSTAKKVAAVKNAFTKSQTLQAIAENTSLTRKQVGAVLDELGAVIHRHIKKGGTGQFTVPGLMKIKTVRKPATKARKGINPFTGLETVFKAKPASTRVKIQPLKNLKEMVK